FGSVMSELTLHEAIRLGLREQQGGNLREAERLYRHALAIDANHPDALHLLGIVAHQSGDDRAALELIRRAIAARPDIAAFHNNLGNILKRLRQLPEAIAAYERALELAPEMRE